MTKAWWTLLALVFLFVSHPVDGSLYNTSNLTSADSLYGQAQAMNDLTDGLVGIGILGMAFLIPFLILVQRTGDFIASLGSGSFFAAVISTMLLPLGLISAWVYQAVVIMAGVGVVLAVWLGSR